MDKMRTTDILLHGCKIIATHTIWCNKSFMKNIFRFKRLIQIFPTIDSIMSFVSSLFSLWFVWSQPCPWGSYISCPHGSRGVPLRAQVTVRPGHLKNMSAFSPKTFKHDTLVISNQTQLSWCLGKMWTRTTMKMSLTLKKPCSYQCFSRSISHSLYFQFQNTPVTQHHHTLRTYMLSRTALHHIFSAD